ncbi:uncharacterized protein LOC111613625 [Centruroides sculpturatus]|uniref:uncharacterized protein LOC111613625 n=1 Tax=Centruroides sculpturatus TaxID=218467 RepID=UPI000C6ED7D1|nr:uncharacterized protein LOC111613625 [Centruroides sculpturatus]
MTPEVVSEILPSQKGMFDLVVFDEGSQIYVEKAIPTILRGQKVLVAGDNKQLRPSSLGVGRIEYDDETEEEEQFGSEAALEEESLLDLACAKYDQTMLDYHYRSKYEELIAFSNYAFYRGRLRVSPNFEKPITPPIEVIKVPNGIWVKRTNHQEAVQVLRLLKQFLDRRQKQETVGIITFNSAQRDLIEDLIDEECRKSPKFATIYKKELERRSAEGEDLGIFIKNIENVQGDERDTIIFSFAYAKNESGRVVRNFGWLNQEGGENRLNVAVTRAKLKIYIVTSVKSSELRVEDLKNRGPKILKKYLQYAEAISDGKSNEAQRILHSLNDAPSEEDTLTFDSEFEIQVYDELVARNFKVETQVGIGGYRIDLAIKNHDQTKYLLGIECDGKLYHSSKTARERDIHRQAYLESRG